jgi:hypothetical protein
MKIFSKSLWIGVTLSFILAIISSFIFVKNGIDLVASRYNSCSIYENSGCDFIIPSPGDEQVDELQGKDFINTVVPFYYTQTTTYVGSKSGNDNVIMMDNYELIENTVYCNSRLISGKEVINHSAMVDYTYAKKYSVQIGDKIKVVFGKNICEYEVCGIYEDNIAFSGGVVLVNWSDQEKQSVISSSSSKLKYSAAWIKANDYSICENYLLSEYKPLGRLKDRDEFDSDAAYQIHVNAFNTASFASEITDFTNSLKQIDNKTQGYLIRSNVFFAFSIILPVLIIFLKSIVFEYGKEKQKVIRKYLSLAECNRKKIIKYKNNEIALSGCLTFIVYLMFFFVYRIISSSYIKISLFAVSCIYVVIFVACIALIIIFNQMKFKKLFKKIKSTQKSNSKNSQDKNSSADESKDKNSQDENSQSVNKK